MKKTNLFYIGFLSLLILAGCVGGGGNKQLTGISNEIQADSDNIKITDSDVFYLFSSPVEILTIINQDSLMFDSKYLNSVEKREKYIKAYDQYLNIGVYLADLSYCSVFARSKEADDYLETLKRMCGEVNLSTEINIELIEKLKGNVNSIDTLIKYTDMYFYKVINDLEKNNRQNEAAIISIGAYIECLYLSVNLVNKYSENNLIILKIAEQKHAFTNLYHYCKQFISNKDLINSFAYLEQINNNYSQFKEIKERVKVKKEGDNHLIISGGITTVISESEFKLFKKNISEIRNSITK